MQIAIDTSTDIASLALAEDGELLAELTWRCGQNHTTQLLPRLKQLLDQAGLDIRDTTGVIVARGPGSFNGLRVGISTAKGLALSLGVPVVGISTLEAAAYPYAETGLPVCPVFNAGRGEIATALYCKEGEQWQRLAEEHITTLEALCDRTTEKTLFCGDHITSIGEQLKSELGEKSVMPSPAGLLRRAGFLAELGQQRLSAGDYDSPAALQPLYLRRPAITRPKRNLWR